MFTKSAKYHLGQIVRHKKHPFRGVVFDVDPEFSNTDEWYESIPEDSRPHKEQPYYHLLAENDHSFYVAYVSEQNLIRDHSGDTMAPKASIGLSSPAWICHIDSIPLGFVTLIACF